MSLSTSSRPRFAQLVDHANELARAESELRLLATALRPSSVSLGGELDAHAGLRRDAHFVRDAQQHIELAFLLDDDEHFVAELLAHEGEAHELLVLVAVADDQVVRRLAEREHRLQLRLAAAFDADAMRRAELHDLLDDVPLLIDLDRIDEGVLSLVLEFLDRAIEGVVERFDARAEDVAEAEEHGEADALLTKIHREIEEIEPAIGAREIGTDDRMSLLVDVEVADAPPFDVVQRARLIDAPRGRCGGRRTSLHSSCHAANLTDVWFASTVPIWTASSRKEATHCPPAAVALVAPTLVQAELAGVPELDARGLRRDGRTSAAGAARAGSAKRASTSATRARSSSMLGELLALLRGPRADLALSRARGEVGIRLGVAHRLDRCLPRGSACRAPASKSRARRAALQRARDPCGC